MRREPLNQIDTRKAVVFYMSPASGPVKLQRVSRTEWGFIYLKRPDLAPVFLERGPCRAMKKVLATQRATRPDRRRTLFTCDLATFARMLAGETAPPVAR